MHDPLVVAFEIRRPWPKIQRPNERPAARWKFRHPSQGRRRWPWQGWQSIWRVAGWQLWWPSLITVWHVEPGGRDALTVCSNRDYDADGNVVFHKRWRRHVNHWRVQVHSLQQLRRRLLTRCEECGRKGSPNFSHSWGREKTRWWQGEKGLLHSECSSLRTLRNTLDDADALAAKMLDSLAAGMDRSQALEWFSDTTDMPCWRAVYRLRNKLGSADDSEARA